MIAISELGVVPLLSRVGTDDLLRLVQAAADVRLGVGEYAVHEGEERALFVVLAGKIEVTKAIDGIERTIGLRAPGQIFGEVPLVFGTPFQGSYRAGEPSRVMRIEAAQFQRLAAASPETMNQVIALARERIGGLQGIATPRRPSRVARWPASARTPPAARSARFSAAIRSASNGSCRMRPTSRCAGPGRA